MARAVSPDASDRAARYREALEALDLNPDRGTVARLVVSAAPGEHVPRQMVRVARGSGCAGDYPRKSYYKGAWVSGREVSAVSLDVLRAVEADPVAVGDNLVVEGFDLATMQAGDRVRVGEVVLVRSDRAHRPCAAFGRRTSSEALAVVREASRRGALFVVARGGFVRVGDAFERP